MHAFVCMCVRMCVYECVCVCVCVPVCPLLRLYIINYWHDTESLQLIKKVLQYIAAVVGIISMGGLSIDVPCRSQPSKTKIVLCKLYITFTLRLHNSVSMAILYCVLYSYMHTLQVSTHMHMCSFLLINIIQHIIYRTVSQLYVNNV